MDDIQSGRYAITTAETNVVFADAATNHEFQASFDGTALTKGRVEIVGSASTVLAAYNPADKDFTLHSDTDLSVVSIRRGKYG